MTALLRYTAVGGVATAAHYALLWIAVEAWGWPPPLAAGAGAALGAQVAFVGNRRFTFAHRGPWRGAWWRFQLTAAFGALTSIAVVALGTRLQHRGGGAGHPARPALPAGADGRHRPGAGADLPGQPALDVFLTDQFSMTAGATLDA